MLQKFLLLSIAGAAGTLCRYGLAGFVHRLTGAGFPWGTLAVNITGCFLAGVVWTLFEHRWPLFGQARVIIMVGFMGAFTTFSSYILETGELLRAADWAAAAGNFFLQNGIGFAALFAGITLARLL